jgi:hypothetical protein
MLLLLYCVQINLAAISRSNAPGWKIKYNKFKLEQHGSSSAQNIQDPALGVR